MKVYCWKFPIDLLKRPAPMRKSNHVDPTKKIERPTREEVFQMIKPIPRPTMRPAIVAMGIEVAV